VSERSELICKLKDHTDSRASYIRGKLNVLIPAQLRALRLRRELKQAELASEADMKQSRISAMECPGAVKFNLETLIRAAAALKVGLEVKFVPFSEMLRWENAFSQDTFDVTPIDDDKRFLAHPSTQLPNSVDMDAAALAFKQSYHGFLVRQLSALQNIVPTPLSLNARNLQLDNVAATPMSKFWSEGSTPIDVEGSAGPNLDYERVQNG
jgi:transcriptional regulator with XRE-family HTH domain